jgi:hypothetical protein
MKRASDAWEGSDGAASSFQHSALTVTQSAGY